MDASTLACCFATSPCAQTNSSRLSPYRHTRPIERKIWSEHGAASMLTGAILLPCGLVLR
jgi:hypothetical protein